MKGDGHENDDEKLFECHFFSPHPYPDDRIPSMGFNDFNKRDRQAEDPRCHGQISRCGTLIFKREYEDKVFF